MLAFQERDAATESRLSTIEVPPKKRALLRLEYERRTREMTLGDVAAAIGCAPSKICEVERGSRRPGRSIAIRLQHLFSLPSAESCVEEVLP
jgi:hypothetical protein